MKNNNVDRLVELAKELERQKKTKKDYVVPTESILVEDTDGKLKMSVVDIGNYEITDICHNQIADKCKIPRNFYQRLLEEYPTLLKSNINELIKEKDKSLVRTLDGKARAFLSSRFRIIDNYDVLFNAMDVFNRLNEANNTGIQIQRADLTDRRLYIKAVSEKLTDTIFKDKEKLEKGDVVKGGIIIQNSEVGHGAYRVSPFMTVVRCNNGMVSDDSFCKIHLGRDRGIGEIDWSNETLQLEDKALWSKITDLIVGTFDKEIFGKWVDKINGIATVEIEKPVLAVNNVVKEYNLEKDKAEFLLQQFAQEGYTQWGLCNAVTRIAQEEKDYEQQIKLEKVGTKILTVTAEELQKEA